MLHRQISSSMSSSKTLMTLSSAFRSLIRTINLFKIFTYKTWELATSTRGSISPLSWALLKSCKKSILKTFNLLKVKLSSYLSGLPEMTSSRVLQDLYVDLNCWKPLWDGLNKFMASKWNSQARSRNSFTFISTTILQTYTKLETCYKIQNLWVYF